MYQSSRLSIMNIRPLLFHQHTPTFGSILKQIPGKYHFASKTLQFKALTINDFFLNSHNCNTSIITNKCNPNSLISYNIQFMFNFPQLSQNCFLKIGLFELRYE